MKAATVGRPPSSYAKAATLVCHLALMVMIGSSGSALALIGAGLLVTALPGLLQNRVRTYQWASMLVVFYCALWLADGWADVAHRGFSFGVAALAAADFVSLVSYVRFRRRESNVPAAGSNAA